MKIKITDFLEMNNKPKEFKYKNYIWKQPKGFNTHLNEDDIDFETYLSSVQICDLGRAFSDVLNDEIEIIEETATPKEIEIKQGYTARGKLYDYLLHEGNKYAISVPQKLIIERVNYLLKRCNKGE